MAMMLIIYPCWEMGNASHWHPVGNLQLLLRSSVWPLLERLCVCVAFQGGPTGHVHHLEKSRGVSVQRLVPVVL